MSSSFLRYFPIFILIFIYSPVHSADLDYYVGGSLKTNFPLKFYHLGWNGDDVCYPNRSNCDQSKHKGYTWIYEVTSGILNPGLGAYAGIRTHKNWRIELSLDGFLSPSKPETEFVGLYYLKENKNPFPDKTSFWDGLIFPKRKTLTGSLTKVGFKESDQSVSSEYSFSNLQLITGLVNAYFDFPIKNNKLTPYLGLGAGYTLVKADIHYESKYKDESLNSLQTASFSSESLSLSARVKVGVNYVVSDKLSYGLEASYTTIKPTSDTLPYEKHPNQENNTTLLRDIRYLTAIFNVTYFL